MCPPLAISYENRGRISQLLAMDEEARSCAEASPAAVDGEQLVLQDLRIGDAILTPLHQSHAITSEQQ